MFYEKWMQIKKYNIEIKRNETCYDNYKYMEVQILGEN